MSGRHAKCRAVTRSKPARVAVTGAVALGLVGPWADGASAADAEGGGNNNQYAVAVEADGVNIDIHNQSFPLTDVIGASPYSAIATLDSSGSSTATAAAPYFGAFLQPLFSTANGLGPGLVPQLPTVPGYVLSSYPTTPSAKQSNGSYNIAADSKTDRSAGTVRLGVVQPGTDGNIHALANTIANSNGSVAASGESGVETLNIGGVLSIGKVVSSLTMTAPGSKEPKIATSTLVSALEVNGVPIGIDENGITVLGTNSAIPAEQFNASVKDALAAAGISLTYLPATETIDPLTDFVQTVESGALQVTLTQAVPGQGEYRIDMIFGRVIASMFNTEIEGAVAGSAVATAGSPTSIDSTSSTTTDSVATADRSAVVTTGRGGGGVTTTAGDSAVSDVVAIDPAAGALPAATQAVTPAAVPTRELATVPQSDRVRLLGAEIAGTASDDTAAGVYLALALCGLLGLGAAGVTRVLAARGAS